MQRTGEGITTATEERTEDKPLEIPITEEALNRLRQEYINAKEYREHLRRDVLHFHDTVLAGQIKSHYDETSETCNIYRLALYTLDEGLKIKFEPKEHTSSVPNDITTVDVRTAMVGIEYQIEDRVMWKIVEALFPEEHRLNRRPPAERDLIKNTLNSGREVYLVSPKAKLQVRDAKL